MRGTLDIRAVIEHNDAAGYVASCRLDTHMHVRMSVHVDCSIDADTTDTSRADSPNYAACATYRVVAVVAATMPVVRYPHCAGYRHNDPPRHFWTQQPLP
jgi:hypothetical protein